MKFMKLGSKPDLFKSEGDSTRYVECDLPPDVIVNIEAARFHLHKFPLISKSQKLKDLLRKESEEEETADELHLYDFPGGPRAFEICAKFCYGINVTLNAHNVVAARCAAEYLEMREDVEKGNLIYKVEVFLNSSIFQSWKDSIICLQIAKALSPWPENLKIVRRCVDSLASKISLDPRAVHWSYTYPKRIAVPQEIVDLGTRSERRGEYLVPVDWWVEDVSDLDVDHFEMVMAAVKDGGKTPTEVMIEGLKAYAERWLFKSMDDVTRTSSLVRSIIRLVPRGGGSRSSCSLLLRLLKVVALTGEDEAREELLTVISTQLEKASVKDLLIPSRPPCSSVYDVDTVLQLFKRFVERGRGLKGSDHGLSTSIWNLIDGYLAEIASDPSLPLSTFVDFARAFPTVTRVAHDGLYTAVDVYLKEHPALAKSEKKELCGLVAVKRLSANTCAHAAQNERLPLRVVVQVLFLGQVRAAEAAAGRRAAPLFPNGKSHSAEQPWENTHPAPNKPAETQLKGLLDASSDGYCVAAEKRRTSRGSERSVESPAPTSRSRRIFDRLWAGRTEKKKRSSESCASPLSSSAASVFQGRSGTSGPSSRLGRHSIS